MIELEVTLKLRLVMFTHLREDGGFASDIECRLGKAVLATWTPAGWSPREYVWDQLPDTALAALTDKAREIWQGESSAPEAST